ncbi:MAG TPA: hypothetical protein DCZ40_00110 [Lachnospiraceae bacterium]|nr:hypothetical protein [Lachnospiraceae bacterium]
MKIVQVVSGCKKGDGVGNVVAVIDELLKKNRYETLICNRRLGYMDVDSELFGRDTIVFYHLALLADPVVKHLKCRKVLVFHNITLPGLLEGTDEKTRIEASAGWYDTAKTADFFDAAITFSAYSKDCLVRLGWKAEKVFVLPILIRFSHFSAEPSGEIIRKYRGNSVNILFTGRVYPNKKQDDIIAAFAAYKELYEKNAKLFLVGSISGGNYYYSLLSYAEKLGVAEDVIFTGHVAFAEYLAYYHIADMYLCMSAHEGFCIPLVEAMYFEVPIIAHASTAVPDTLAGCGVLLDSREPKTVAGVMNRVMADKVYRQSIMAGQHVRLKQLLPETLERQYMEVLGNIVNGLCMSDNDISEIKNDDKYQFTLSYDLSWQIERLAGKQKKYVVYGAGAAGTRLYAELKKNCGEEGLVLCDSYKAGNYDASLGCPIISPKEAARNYADGIFILSIQDKRAVLEAALCLVGEGINLAQLLFYDRINNQIF